MATSCVLAILGGSVGWKVWNDLPAVSNMVDLGIVVYAAIASLVEVGVRMAFYAIEQRQKDRERIRRKARQEGRQEGRREGLQEGREVLRAFAHSMILKANQNPEASIEELVKAVTSEMEEAEEE